MFVRLGLEDLGDAETVQTATMFGWVAERFLGTTDKELDELEDEAAVQLVKANSAWRR